MQSKGTLLYGAWIGARIGRAGDAFKLYVEVPRGARTEAFEPPHLALGDRPVTPRMIACVPGRPGFEHYLRVPSLAPAHLTGVLAPAGLEARAAPLLDLLADAYGHSIHGRIPGPSVGVSYAVGPAGPTVSLHLYARALWGSDTRIRRGFPRLAGRSGWDDRIYLDVTAPLAGRDGWRTYHGLAGVTLDRGASPSFTIGVRPVQP
jgi:hypothetical protein